MEEEADNFINIIFPDGVPGHLQESAEFPAYLTKLGTLRVEELSKEPDRLADEEASVLEQTQELAFANYKTFIQTAECSRAIFQQFKKTEGHLEDLLGRVPQFTEQCQDFSRSSSTLESKRRLCTLTLSRSTQILELLEIPQLMTMCVNGGHYEEALQLAAFVRRLERRHNSIPAITSIVKDTQIAWQAMLHQLLSQLRSDLPLPKCLLVVGLLRRMEVFSEAELRLKFLQARDSWLCSQLESVPKDRDHLSRTVELSRQHLFAISTQYRAAFSDDPTRATNNEAAIFHGWLTQKVSQFVTTLEADLYQIEESESLDSVLSQCMYFGLSLARVGADFRGIMAPVFTKTIRHNFECTIKKATKEFESQIEKMNFDKFSSSSLNPPASPNSMHPPVSLLQFTPLALFCNAILSACNTLRLNAPLALAAPITTLVQNVLLAASKAILARYRQEELAFSSVEQQGVQRLCTCFADDFVPHIQRCLQSLYPVSVLATHLGLSPQQIQRDGIGFLNKAEIVEPIKHLLPVNIEPLSLVQQGQPKLNKETLKEDEPLQNLVSYEPLADEPEGCEESNVTENQDLLSGSSVGVVTSDVPLVPVKIEQSTEDEIMTTSNESFDMCNSRVEELNSKATVFDGLNEDKHNSDLQQ
ncbi:conserved oligomeric Golgi complex subunit 8 [Neocloeon triangulifer]|uniref:conserved oligomeric Golgi complex subunit 8 n=1 Tax=Neocloeon triangulifer TaxID=2078957 RepID=UPI00286F9DB4|nr:conserved oligomeric Golgi complex subunit 8 [Neocloeon triangulifer]